MFRFAATRMMSATPVALASGKITSFNRQKGFGFVEESGDAKKSHFVHFSAIQCEGGYKAVDVGVTVEFDVAPDERNPDRTRAINVRAPGGGMLPAPERRQFEDGGNRGGGGGDFRGGRGRGGGGGGYRGRGGRGGGDNRRDNSHDDF